MQNNRTERIQKILEQRLSPVSVRIIDDSARHAGHAGVRESGGGHFTVDIVADCFAGLSRLARHRLVYRALKDVFGPTIHALNIRASTPEETRDQTRIFTST